MKKTSEKLNYGNGSKMKIKYKFRKPIFVKAKSVSKNHFS